MKNIINLADQTLAFSLCIFAYKLHHLNPYKFMLSNLERDAFHLRIVFFLVSDVVWPCSILQVKYTSTKIDLHLFYSTVIQIVMFTMNKENLFCFQARLV